MADMKKINLEELDNVTGGVQDIVQNNHEGFSYANCRMAPGLNADVLYTVPNGTKVVPTGRVVIEDNIEWYEVQLEGGAGSGWMAGNLIGR